MATAQIALGSNLGERGRTIDRALAALRDHPDIRLVRVSDRIETEPVGGPPNQGRFINAAASLETDLDPEALLEELKSIERRLGRRERERWGPREIDLDLILYEDRQIDTDCLTLPHPRFRERRFVLQPLAEIAPDATDPETGKTVTELLNELKESGS